MMATGFTDFSEVTEGQSILSHGWEDDVGSGWASPALNHPIAVVDGSAPVSDRYVEMASNTNASHNPAGWRFTSAPASASRMQLLVCVARGQSNATQCGAVGRASGSRNSETGVAGVLRNNDTDIRYIDLAGGTPTYSAGVAHGVPNANAWTWIRTDLNGSTISMRAWQDGDPEPGAWQLVETTATTQAGWPGLYVMLSATARTVRFGYFSYGTDGDAAPGPGGPAPVTGTIAVTETDDTLAASGTTASSTVTGTVAVTETADTLAASGTAAPLDTPPNVQVVVTSRTSATVTWDDVPAADLFQVEARVRAGQS